MFRNFKIQIQCDDNSNVKNTFVASCMFQLTQRFLKSAYTHLNIIISKCQFNSEFYM